jgi:hypothetical protein
MFTSGLIAGSFLRGIVDQSKVEIAKLKSQHSGKSFKGLVAEIKLEYKVQRVKQRFAKRGQVLA